MYIYICVSDCDNYRVECLIALKRYTESFSLVEKELDGCDNADMLVIRAQLNLLFGKVYMYTLIHGI